MVGRFLSPDNLLHGGSQGINRYSYALNNPLIYSDPDGECPILVGVLIGAAFGAYSGYKMGQAFGAKGVEMAAYIFGGAIVGMVSGGISGVISALGGILANSISMMVGSSLTSMYSNSIMNGSINPTINFGAASYDFENNEWGYLGKKGNKWYEDLGYAMGAWTNVSDAWAVKQGVFARKVAKEDVGSINLKTKWEVGLGHSASVNDKGETLLSFGATDEYELPWLKSNHPEKNLGTAFEKMPGTVDYPIRGFNTNLKINNVRIDKFNSYRDFLNVCGDYRLASFFPSKFTMHCAIANSRALLNAGVFNIPFLRTPYFLDIQMRIRNISQYGYNLNSFQY